MSLCVCFSVSVYLSPFSNSIDDFITHPGVQTKDLLLLFCSVCNLLLQQSTAIFTAQIHPKLVLLFVSTATTQIQLISCLDPCNNLFLASFFHFCLPVVYSTYSRQHGHSRHSLAEAVASPHTLHHGLRSLTPAYLSTSFLPTLLPAFQPYWPPFCFLNMSPLFCFQFFPIHRSHSPTDFL